MVRIAKALIELFTHPPILVIMSAIIAGVADQLIPLPDILVTPWNYSGSLFFVLGLYLCLAGVKELWIKKTTVVPHGMPTSLADTGIYHWSRNPIYLGYLSALVGIACYLGSLQALIGAVFFFLIIDSIIIPMEERNLRAALGTVYDHYRAKTRRWV